MSKYSEIADSIKKDIDNNIYQAGSKLPTEFEMSKMYNASRLTVRQAISVLKNEGIVNQIQGSGTYVSQDFRKKTRKDSSFPTVQVICTYISDYIFPSIIRGIEHKLSGSNISVKLSATGNMIDKERNILMQVLEGHDTDALIIEGTKTAIPNPNIPLYKKIQEMGIPLVFIHCAYPELTDSVVVGMNDYEGGKTAVKALVDAGCKKIGGIFKSDDLQGLQRYKGFAEEIVNSGIGLENSTVRWFTTEDIIRTNMHVSKDQAEEFSDYDGLVCYNDQIATSFIRDCSIAGVKLPKLFSFDKSLLAETSNVKFESIGHMKDVLGEVAAEKICNMLEGKKESSTTFDWC